MGPLLVVELSRPPHLWNTWLLFYLITWSTTPKNTFLRKLANIEILSLASSNLHNGVDQLNGTVVLQITGETVGEVKAVADMHQRKAEMARHSDAFIALPGWYINLYDNIFFFCFLLPNRQSN